MATAIATSERALLFRFYPLLLEVAFLDGHIPSMWMFPDEHAKLYATMSPTESNVGDGETVDHQTSGVEVNGMIDAGDGGDLIEVTARDLARRCLEIVGAEIGMGR